MLLLLVGSSIFILDILWWASTFDVHSGNFSSFLPSRIARENAHKWGARTMQKQLRHHCAGHRAHGKFKRRHRRRRRRHLHFTSLTGSQHPKNRKRGIRVYREKRTMLATITTFETT